MIQCLDSWRFFNYPEMFFLSVGDNLTCKEYSHFVFLFVFMRVHVSVCLYVCVFLCFLVSDGEHTTPELDFAVLLLSNHQQPPVFQVLDPFLEVSLGGRAAIGKTQTNTQNKYLFLRRGGEESFEVRP